MKVKVFYGALASVAAISGGFLPVTHGFLQPSRKVGSLSALNSLTVVTVAVTLAKFLPVAQAAVGSCIDGINNDVRATGTNLLCDGIDFVGCRDRKTWTEHKAWVQENWGGDMASIPYNSQWSAMEYFFRGETDWNYQRYAIGINIHSEVNKEMSDWVNYYYDGSGVGVVDLDDDTGRIDVLEDDGIFYDDWKEYTGRWYWENGQYEWLPKNDHQRWAWDYDQSNDEHQGDCVYWDGVEFFDIRRCTEEAGAIFSRPIQYLQVPSPLTNSNFADSFEVYPLPQHDDYKLYDVCQGPRSLIRDSSILVLHGQQTFQLDASPLKPLFPDTKGKFKLNLRIEWRYADPTKTSSENARFCVSSFCVDAPPNGASWAETVVSVDDNLGDTPSLKIENAPAIDNADVEVKIPAPSASDYECPDLAEIKLDGSPRCECQEGFTNEQGGKSVSFQEGTCKAAYNLVAKAGAQWITVEGFTDALKSSVEDLEKSLQLKGPDSNLIQVGNHHGGVINYANMVDNDNGAVRLGDLLPGRRFFLEFKPRDAQGGYLDLPKMAISIVTHCSCSEVDGADITGPPVGLTTQQKGGFISFSFKGNSRCEEGYAFTRHQGEGESNKQVFTPNYYFVPRERCTNEEIRTGKQAADNLFDSNLAVGTNYTYCVRAMARTYMDSVVSESDPPLVSSSNTCTMHKVRFEASVDGRVSLEPKLGALPVAGVEVKWKLMDPSLSGDPWLEGSTTTGEGGGYKITINEELDLNNDVEYPLHLQFRKISKSGNESISHVFRCDSGTRDCTDAGTYAFVKHLDFDVPVETYDTTSVPFKGTVVVGGTSYEDQLGCPIHKAKVCLLDMIESGTSKGVALEKPIELCVETAADGTYSLPALIGSRVSVEIEYNNHTFLPYNDTEEDLYEHGIDIKAGYIYADRNFKDVTTATLDIEVAGGRCDLDLGTSTLILKVDAGSCEWEQEMLQEGVLKQNEVPAQQLKVELVKLEKDGSRLFSVEEYFQGKEQRIDLRGLKKLKENESPDLTSTNNATVVDDEATKEEKELIEQEEKKEEEDQDKKQKIRFQFDGEPYLRLEVPGDKAGACNAQEYDSDCDSLHVVHAARLLDMKMHIQYEVLDNEFCDIVDKDLPVRLINDNLGVSADDKATWQEYESLSSREKEVLELCSESDGGCDLSVNHTANALTGELSDAHVRAALVSGPPNIAGKHLKQVTYYIGEAQTPHKACFVVEGDFSRGFVGSAALPTHKPVLTLRDPPGGLSYAVYENVRTTFTLNTASSSHYAGFSAELQLAARADPVTSACAGFGVMACSTVVEADNGFAPKAEHETTFRAGFREKAWGGGIETTWTYQTSDHPSYPGRPSDAFVVPNLSVKYADVSTISFDVGTCEANREDTVKFNLNSEANKPALSFVTVAHVEDRIIPKLEEMEGILAEKSGDDEASAELVQIRAGLQGWRDTMEEYEQTNQKAADGELAADYSAQDWWKWARNNTGNRFQGTDNPEKLYQVYLDAQKVADAADEVLDEGGRNVSPEAQAAHSAYFAYTTARDANLGVKDTDEDATWAGLIPYDLLKRARPLNDDVDQEEDQQTLKKTNQFEFSGGGNVMEYSITYHNNFEHSFQLGGVSDNREHSTALGTDIELGFKAFGIGIQAESTIMGHYNYENSHEETQGQESSTTVSLVLGDEDDPDYFVFDVFVDPVYGTLVFNTVAGASMCIHEPNTAYSAKARIAVTSKPPGRGVLPDSEMVFGVDLSNVGISDWEFQLYPFPETNLHNLGLYVNGGELTDAHRYPGVAASETLSTTLTVTRGAVGYKFPPLKIGFRSGTDCLDIADDDSEGEAELFNYVDGNSQRWILFEQLCPKVHFAGDLLYDQSFTINKKFAVDQAGKLQVAVFNPAYQTDGSFADMVEDPLNNLKQVPLLYRQEGTTRWRQTMTETADGPKPIDFALIEQDNYGYMTATWDFESLNLKEGTYELKVEAQCKVFGGAPDEFKRFSDPPLKGLIDMTPPSLYGAPKPSNDAPLWPGEEVSFTFTEEIDCEMPYNFAMRVAFGKRTETRIKRFCEGRTIGFTFDPLITDEIKGQKFKVSLARVLDLAGNRQENQYSKSAQWDVLAHFFHADLDLTGASTSFQVTLDSGCKGEQVVAKNNIIKSQVAKRLGGGAGLVQRMELQGKSCSVSGVMTVDVLVKSVAVTSETTAQRRGLRTISNTTSLEDGWTSLEVANILANATGAIRHLKILPGVDDMKRKNVHAAIPLAAEEGTRNLKTTNDMAVGVDGGAEAADINTLLLQELRSLHKKVESLQREVQVLQDGPAQG